MILFGINFNVYFLLLIRRRPKEALKSEEMRWYLIIIAAAIGLITLKMCIRDSRGTLKSPHR